MAEDLGVDEELTISAGWEGAVNLLIPEAGNYRLEPLTLSGEPVEVVVERLNDNGTWLAVSSNRTLKGNALAYLDFSTQKGQSWRVIPAGRKTPTVILRLRHSSFAGLRDSVKQGLISGPSSRAPLTLRAELPPGLGGRVLGATTGSKGELWLGWVDDTGKTEVWDATKLTRLGAAIDSPEKKPTRIQLTANGRLSLTWEGPAGRRVLDWTGADWAASDSVTHFDEFVTKLGTFRASTEAPVRVLRETGEGWIDLELPQDREADKVLLGSSEDGLYVLLASTRGPHRAMYGWTKGRGWIALPPPPSRLAESNGLWAVTSGTGSLIYVEGQSTSLTLWQFDGTDWSSPLDLTPLAPQGVRAAVLLPASAWSRTGSLILASDRVRIYDLP